MTQGFPQFCYHIMSLPWQRTFCHCRKMCLAHLHPKANICTKFHENRSKTEEVVRDAIFPPICFHNMPLPWQRTFSPVKNVSCTSTPTKTNIWAKFYDNRSKTEQVVRVARFTPNFYHIMPLPWQRTFCHCRKMCLVHLHSKANICAKFHENRSKN